MALELFLFGITWIFRSQLSLEDAPESSLPGSPDHSRSISPARTALSTSLRPEHPPKTVFFPMSNPLLSVLSTSSTLRPLAGKDVSVSPFGDPSSAFLPSKSLLRHRHFQATTKCQAMNRLDSSSRNSWVSCPRDPSTFSEETTGPSHHRQSTWIPIGWMCPSL